MMDMLSRAVNAASVLLRDLRDVNERQHRFHGVRPDSATIFLTYRCNSRCRTCTFWLRDHKEEKKKEIDLEEWKTIIDQLADAGIHTVEVFGGNVLLRKKLLIGVLEHLERRNMSIHLPTNQIGLDEEIGKAIAAYVDHVYISTDGVGESQDEIRGLKGSADRSETTVALLRRLRAGNGSPPILVCNTTVSKYNFHLLEPMVDYALAHGFDEVHFEYAGEFTDAHIDDSLIDGLRPSPYYVQQDSETILVSRDQAKRLKEGLRSVKKKYANADIDILSVNIDVLSAAHLSNGTIPHKECYVERLEATVDPSGNLIACPFINNYVMGNVLEQGLQAVWNNSKHRRFRELQNCGALEMCKHCILGAQRNPGFFTQLKRIYHRRIGDALARR
jgi:MoaA/NifB/PqqE/SkfB family radical SAM enzyme